MKAGMDALLRNRAINIDRKEILITNFYNTKQERDLTEPPNCNGFGRIRHFKLDAGSGWIINPLPILPAAKALAVKSDSQIRTQVFQNSVCNWRCWYCFVDYSSLIGDPKHCLSPLNSWTKFGKQFCNNLNLGYEKHQTKIYS